MKLSTPDRIGYLTRAMMGRCANSKASTNPMLRNTDARAHCVEKSYTGTKTEKNMSKTQVGHCKRDTTDVYVGRGIGGRSMVDTKIGVRGWLGNPHTLDDYTREESINLFRDDFEARLRGDEEFREAVKALHGKTLGCWCQSVSEDSPACHGEVIAEWVDKLNDE